MVLRVILLTLVIIYEVEMVPILRSQPRHKRVATKTGKCDMESYFDPNLGKNGRCQPCGEICNPNWGTEDQCLANFDQCKGTYMSYHSTTSSTLTTEELDEPKSQTMMIVAIATGLVALVTILLLAGYLYKRHRKIFQNCCRSCVNRSNLVKSVDESSLHNSRDKMCVSGVNHPLSSAGQALLGKYGQEESTGNSIGLNPESVV